jgi:hypothetical protein
MRPLLLATFVILILLTPVARGQEDAERMRLRASIEAEVLEVYSASERKEIPSVASAFRLLASSDPAARRTGGLTLEILLRVLFADESNGRVAWRSLPFWGGGSESPAREYRKDVAKQIRAKAPRADELVPALEWLVFDERLAESCALGAEALREVKGEAATQVLARIVEKRHPIGKVLSAATAELAARARDKAAPLLRALVDHHRKDVRELARGFLEKRGERLTSFSPAAAIEPFRATLAAISSMAITPVRDARFVRIRVPTTGGDGKETTEDVTGFDLGGTGSEKYRLLTTHLDEVVVERKRPLSSDDRAELPLADEVKRVTAIRAKAIGGDRDALGGLSRRGGLTAQFEAGAVSDYEAFLAATCLERGDATSAAALLLPPLETLDDDRWFFEIVRDHWGTLQEHRLLELFAGDRDYEGAIKLADHILASFLGLSTHARVTKLARELPTRRDDFRTFTFPTPEEWASKRKTLSRVEAIDYLAERLRLFNCFQMGQPGGVDMSEKQWAEPGGLSDAAWRIREGKTELVNPYTELRRLELKVADIATLAPHLLDDRYAPTVTFWRDFHPDRSLWQVNQIIAGMIDDIARRPLAELSRLESLDEAGKKAHIAAIDAWAEANSKKTEADLLLESLARDQRWSDAKEVVDEIVKKIDAAVPTILRYLERPDVSKWDIGDILRACSKLDGKLALEPALKNLDHADLGVRLQAAIVVLRFGDAEKGRRVVADVMARGDVYSLLERDAVDGVAALVSTGDAHDLEIAKHVIEHGFRNPEQIIQAFGDKGGVAAHYWLERLEKDPDDDWALYGVLNGIGRGKVGVEPPGRDTTPEQRRAISGAVIDWLKTQTAGK